MRVAVSVSQLDSEAVECKQSSGMTWNIMNHYFVLSIDRRHRKASKIKAKLLLSPHRIPQSCALIMMITTLLTLIKLKLHLADISFHFHAKMSLVYLAIANQKSMSIFYELRDFIHRHLTTSFMVCIDIFKRFQIVIVGGIFTTLKNMFQ